MTELGDFTVTKFFFFTNYLSYEKTLCALLFYDFGILKLHYALICLQSCHGDIAESRGAYPTWSVLHIIMYMCLNNIYLGAGFRQWWVDVEGADPFVRYALYVIAHIEGDTTVLSFNLIFLTRAS